MKEEFLAQIAEVFEVEANEISLETDFKNHDNWGSLTSLTLFAMLDEVYNLNLTNEELDEMNSLQDLFNLLRRSN